MSETPHVSFVLESIDLSSNEAQELMNQLDEFQAPLYPPESNHLDSPDSLSRANAYVIGARTSDGELVGIGAVKPFKENGYGEMKRVFVVPKMRGSKVASSIVAELERFLVTQDIWLMRLETGNRQDAAIRFYERSGYVRRGPFGSYGPDPLSVFMEKDLADLLKP